MTQASLLRPTRKTDAKYLRDQVLLAEGYAADTADDAVATAADRVQTGLDVVSAEAAKNQAAAHQSAAEAARDQATAVVVSGDTSYDPAANQVPLARSNGKIDPQWIQGAAYPGNAVDTSGALTGALIPSNTQWEFTPAMARAFTVFVPEALTTEIRVYTDGVQGIYITTDRKIRLNCYGIYETTATLPVFGDYVTIQLDRNDNETDTVTVFFMVNGVLFDTVKVSDFSDLYIRSLLDGEDGLFWSVSPAHGMNNSTGTVHLNNPGDAIGLQYDLGPNEINAAQATATARPLIGRWPAIGRRNLAISTEDLTGSDGSALIAGTDEIILSSDPGIYAIWRIYPVDSNTTYVYSMYVRKGTFDYVFAVYDDTHNDWFEQNIPPNNPINPDTFTRIWYSFTTPPGCTAVRIYPARKPGSFDGGNVFVTKQQFELGDTPTPYQRVGATSRDVTEPGVPDVYYAYFDGSDDILPFTVPAITDGTIVLAGTNGIWIDSLTVSAGTFNLGPTTYTGGPAGILAVVGDMIGMFIIGRALTAGEETALINYFKGKGAPDTELNV